MSMLQIVATLFFLAVGTGTLALIAAMLWDNADSIVRALRMQSPSAVLPPLVPARVRVMRRSQPTHRMLAPQRAAA